MHGSLAFILSFPFVVGWMPVARAGANKFYPAPPFARPLADFPQSVAASHRIQANTDSWFLVFEDDTSLVPPAGKSARGIS
jgi:hypothetical protein